MSSKTPAPLPLGINVVGHLSSPAGLGHTARMFVRVLQRHGRDVVGFDVERPDGIEAARRTGLAMATDPRALPHAHTLVIASLQQLPRLWLRFGDAMFAADRRFAGVLFWELPAIPPAWLPSLQAFDAIVTCSDFTHRIAADAAPGVALLDAEHPLEPANVGDVDRAAVRRRYGISADCVAFACSFDPRSGLARKNPAGTIRAFLDAFEGRSDVCLVVKSSGPVSADDLVRSGVPTSVRGDPRLVWIDEYLSAADLLALFASCDVFVSLHRSEGLGLVPLEAMSLGKLVIATGYSGNMHYMDDSNSMPVPYRLVDADDATHFITRSFVGAGARWAEPDLAAASACMRRAADDRGVAEALAAKARIDVAVRQEAAWRADWIDDLASVFAASTRSSARRGLRTRIIASELLDPTLLAKNVRLAGRWLGRRVGR